MSVTRLVAVLVFIVAVAIVADACRRVVDLTPGPGASDATSSIDSPSDTGSGSGSGDVDGGLVGDGGSPGDASIPPD